MFRARALLVRLALAGLLGTGLAHAQTVPTASESVTVYVDQAKVMRIAQPAATIILGNPAIADVVLQDQTTLVITGRSYGATNLIVLNSNGDPIADAWLVVQAPQAFAVTVFRGTERYSYSCGGLCQPAPIPGDQPGFFDQVQAQTTTRNDAAAAQARP